MLQELHLGHGTKGVTDEKLPARALSDAGTAGMLSSDKSPLKPVPHCSARAWPRGPSTLQSCNAQTVEFPGLSVVLPASDAMRESALENGSD